MVCLRRGVTARAQRPGATACSQRPCHRQRPLRSNGTATQVIVCEPQVAPTGFDCVPARVCVSSHARNPGVGNLQERPGRSAGPRLPHCTTGAAVAQKRVATGQALVRYTSATSPAPRRGLALRSATRAPRHGVGRLLRARVAQATLPVLDDRWTRSGTGSSAQGSLPGSTLRRDCGRAGTPWIALVW